jgi:hypothetical protein
MKNKKKKEFNQEYKPFVIGGIALLILVLITIVAVFIASKLNKPVVCTEHVDNNSDGLCDICFTQFKTDAILGEDVIEKPSQTDTPDEVIDYTKDIPNAVSLLNSFLISNKLSKQLNFFTLLLEDNTINSITGDFMKYKISSDSGDKYLWIDDDAVYVYENNSCELVKDYLTNETHGIFAVFELTHLTYDEESKSFIIDTGILSWLVENRKDHLNASLYDLLSNCDINISFKVNENNQIYSFSVAVFKHIDEFTTTQIISLIYNNESNGQECLVSINDLSLNTMLYWKFEKESEYKGNLAIKLNDIDRIVSLDMSHKSMKFPEDVEYEFLLMRGEVEPPIIDDGTIESAILIKYSRNPYIVSTGITCPNMYVYDNEHQVYVYFKYNGSTYDYIGFGDSDLEYCEAMCSGEYLSVIDHCSAESYKKSIEEKYSGIFTYSPGNGCKRLIVYDETYDKYIILENSYSSPTEYFYYFTADVKYNQFCLATIDWNKREITIVEHSDIKSVVSSYAEKQFTTANNSCELIYVYHADSEVFLYFTYNENGYWECLIYAYIGKGCEGFVNLETNEIYVPVHDH